jgi:hypothetical protein
LSSNIALSPCIIPVTLTLWPTCGLRSSELISSMAFGISCSSTSTCHLFRRCSR